MERAGEEDVVLEVDVPHQLPLELLEPDVERSPRRARLGGRDEPGGELAHPLEVGAVIVVLEIITVPHGTMSPPAGRIAGNSTAPLDMRCQLGG